MADEAPSVGVQRSSGGTPDRPDPDVPTADLDGGEKGAGERGGDGMSSGGDRDDRRGQRPWDRHSSSCSVHHARGSGGAGTVPGGRPTLKNRGEYGGGVLSIVASASPDSDGQVYSPWSLLYEKGDPIVGIVDASIDDIDDSAIFYHPSFVGFSSKRGSVWRGDVAVLQSTDASRRVAKGSTLHCQLVPGPADTMVFVVDCTVPTPTHEPEPEPEHAGCEPEDAAAIALAHNQGAHGQPEFSAGDGSSIGGCEAWSIRRLRMWLDEHAPTAVRALGADQNDRTVTTSHLALLGAWRWRWAKSTFVMLSVDNGVSRK